METISSNTPVQVVGHNMSSKSAVSRGRSVLESDAVLKDRSRRWLLRALDPFHDTAVKPEGFPDLDASASVVQEINVSVSISAPAGLTASQNWDCHIVNMADFASASAIQYGVAGVDQPNQTSLVNVTYNSGTMVPSWIGGDMHAGTGLSPIGLNILSCLSGSNTMPSSGATNMSQVSVRNLDVNRYVTGKCRVVGGGFEVVNTTASMYQQGVVTAYRMPQVCTATKMSLSATNHYPAVMLVLPPENVASALLLPGSRQWPASRGSYSVFTLSEPENPFVVADSRPRLYTSTFGYGGGVAVPGLLSALRATDGTTLGHYHMPFNTSGVYYSGLSAQTTLQVNLKLIVEVAPGPYDALATLASESPEYDPAALELYSRVVSRLPPSVPQDENPAGEFFKQILGTVGDLMTMGGHIHPALGMVGRGVRAVGAAAPTVERVIRSTIQAVNQGKGSTQKQQGKKKTRKRK